MARRRTLAAGLLSAALATSVTTACTKPAPATEHGEERFTLTVQDLQGEPVDVAALRGDGVLVVEFWATWCSTCRTARPFFDELQKTRGGDGLTVVAISTDASVEPVTEFLTRSPRPYTVLWDPDAAVSSALLTRMFVQYLPTTLVIDRDGFIRYRHWEWGPDAAAKIEAKVLEALGRE